MKKIKVFIASSIKEFKIEREKIENFLFRLGYKMNIQIVPIRSEYFDSNVRKDGSQNAINMEIKDCDIVIFVFGKKIGQYTKKEFKIATEKYDENISKYNIHIYVKNKKKSKLEAKSLIDTSLSQKHYYVPFDNIEQVEIDFFNNFLSKYGKTIYDDGGIIFLKEKDNKYYIQLFNDSGMEICLNDVDMLKNNNQLSEQLKRLSIINVEEKTNIVEKVESIIWGIIKNYLSLKSLMQQNEDIVLHLFRKKYDFNDLSKILDDLIDKFKANIDAGITQSKISAIYFLETAISKINILYLEKIVDDKETKIDNIKNFFKETVKYLQDGKILLLDDINNKSGDMIINKLYYELKYDYAVILLENDDKECYQQFEDIIKYYEGKNDNYSDEMLSLAYNKFGICHNKESRFDEAYTYYKKALDMRIKLVDTYSYFNKYIAQSYMNITSLVSKPSLNKESIDFNDYFEKSIEVINKCEKDNEDIKIYYIRIYTNYASYLLRKNDKSLITKAEEILKEAEEMLLKCKKYNPIKYYEASQFLYNIYSKFYTKCIGYDQMDKNLIDKAINYQNKAIDNCKIGIDYNPIEFGYYLAQAYNGLADLYQNIKKFDLEKENLNYSIIELDKIIGKSNMSNQYIAFKGIILCELSKFEDEFEKKNKMVDEAISLIESVNYDNDFNLYYSHSLETKGNLFFNIDDKINSLKYYKLALGAYKSLPEIERIARKEVIIRIEDNIKKLEE